MTRKFNKYGYNKEEEKMGFFRKNDIGQLNEHQAHALLVSNQPIYDKELDPHLQPVGELIKNKATDAEAELYCAYACAKIIWGFDSAARERVIKMMTEALKGL